VNETKQRSLILRERYDLTVPEHSLIKRGTALAESLGKKKPITSEELMKLNRLLDEEKGFITYDDVNEIFPKKRRIRVGETITTGELAKHMGVKVGEVIVKLMKMGVMVTINQSIDFDIISLIASEFGFQVEKAEVKFEDTMSKPQATEENLRLRAPIVTIMGHDDHGKTSLLEAIRQTNAIEGEASDITQAIGTFHIHFNGRDIVFLDIPGHEAITSMNAYGGQVPDIVVLVVAADEGVMDQTIEAINHSKAAGVPILVVINKIDKPGADPEKIEQALTEHGLLSEQWGGDTIYCWVSAKKKTGIEALFEMILLQADVLELK